MPLVASAEENSRRASGRSGCEPGKGPFSHMEGHFVIHGQRRPNSRTLLPPPAAWPRLGVPHEQQLRASGRPWLSCLYRLQRGRDMEGPMTSNSALPVAWPGHHRGALFVAWVPIDRLAMLPSLPFQGGRHE